MEFSTETTSKFYEEIIADTIGTCQEIFLDEGVDEGILQELEQIWKKKLKQSRAVTNGEDIDDESIVSSKMTPTLNQVQSSPLPKAVSRNSMAHNDQNADVKFINLPRVQPSSMASNIPFIPTTLSSSVLPISTTNQNVNVPMSTSMSSSSQIFVNNQRPVARNTFPSQQVRPYPNIYVQRGVVYNPFRMVPIQVTISNGEAIFIQVPHMLLTGQRIQYLLSPLITQATIGLNPMQASQVIQQHINNYVQAHTQNAAAVASAAAAAASQQSRSKGLTIFRQLDGQNDYNRKRKKARESKYLSSSSDDDKNSKASNVSVSSEDSADSDDSQKEDENSGGGDDDSVPLNSDDDITDTETDYFQTDNLIVCQYFKISRIRNVWRLIFKDGIANLNGKDYVFQRLMGDASW